MFTSHRVLSHLRLAGLIAVLLAGCGWSADPTGPAVASSTVPVSSASAAIDAASVTASSAATPAAKLQLRTLPEALLKPISGFRYAKTPGPVIYPSAVSGPKIWEGGLV